MLAQPVVAGAEAVDLIVLHQGDGLDARADGDRGAVVDDVFGGGGDGHQAGRALAIHRHARDGDRQAGAQGGRAGDVGARCALLQGAAHDHVVHFARVDPGALDGFGDGVSAQGRAGGVVEGAPISPADRRAGGGDDNGFAHRVSCRFRERIGGAENQALMSAKRLPSEASFSSRAEGLNVSPMVAWNSFILASTLSRPTWSP